MSAVCAALDDDLRVRAPAVGAAFVLPHLQANSVYPLG